MAGRTVTYTFVADVDNFEKGVAGARRKASEFFTGVQKDIARLASGRQLAGAFKDVGQTMTSSFTVPIVAGFGAVIKASSDFDREMTRSLAIMGPISDDLRRKMEDNARSVAKTYGVSHAEAAKSYYSLASAGMTAQQSMAALPSVAQFAKAGMMEMGQATDLLVSSQTALGLSSKDPIKNQQELAHVADVLVNANNGAIGSVQEFAEALSNKAAAAMRTYHVSVEQGTAVLMAYAQAGIQGATAGERYDILLRELTGAALKHADAFKAAKVAVFDHTGALRPMGDIIGDIEKRFAGMSDAQRVTELGMLGIKAKSQSAILGLLGMSQAIRDNEKTLHAQGSTAAVAEKQMKSFSEQLNLLKVSAVDVAISLGQSVLPVAQRVVAMAKDDLVPAIQGAVTWFKALPTGVQDATIGFTAFLAVLGPGIYVIGSVATAIGTVTRAVKVLMATNVATWVATLAGGQGLIGVLGAAGASLSGFLAVAVPWGAAATAVFLGVYAGVKKLIDAIPGLRAAIDMEADNAYAWYTGQSNRDRMDPSKNAGLGPATLDWMKKGGQVGGANDTIWGTGISQANGVADSAKKAAAAAAALNEELAGGKNKGKKSFLQDYLDELKQIPKTASEIGKAVRESILEGAARAGYGPLIATALNGVTTVTGKGGALPGMEMPGPAQWIDPDGWYNHAGQPGYAAAGVAASGGTKLAQTLQNLTNIFDLATNATGRLGAAARSLASVAGAGAGLATGIDALKKGGLGSGLGGLLKSLPTIGGAISSALSIGSAIFGLFKKKPKEPAPAPPAAVDAGTWKGFQNEQLSKGTSGLAAGVGGIQITSSADMASQASIAGQHFWAVFKTQGIVAAAAAAKDVISKLVASLAEHGSASAEAILAPIQQQIALAENESYAGAASGAQGFSEVLASQVNARMPMAIDQFNAYGQQAQAAFNQAKAAAIDQGLTIEQANQAAYAAAGPLIQGIIDAAAQYGIKVDETTQSLIDNAAANGVAFSTDPTDRLVMSIDALTLALGGVPPAINEITGAVNRIPTDVRINVSAHANGTGFNPDVAPPDGFTPTHLDASTSAKGFGTLRPKKLASDTLFQAHAGEHVLIVPAGMPMNTSARGFGREGDDPIVSRHRRGGGGAGDDGFSSSGQGSTAGTVEQLEGGLADVSEQLGGVVAALRELSQRPTGNVSLAPVINVPLDFTAVRANKEALMDEVQGQIADAIKAGTSPIIYQLERLGFVRS